MPTTKRAALYLRSTKDRSDASIASQRRELNEYARRENLEVVEEFADAVESAKDENRPAFQRLLQRIRDKDRGWSVLLATDTARISRRTEFAHAFRHEVKRRGVDMRYLTLPDTDRITQIIVYSTLTAMDEVHSLMSKMKGLAGMAENVSAGWRAGGRAPVGYQLEHVGTGTMREGREVTKTRLRPTAELESVGLYLRKRAQGASRREAIDASGFKRATSTLVGIEWNALTYAGATTWNVMSERLADGGYEGGHRRKPRDQWRIQHNTHPAIIELDEAEALVSSLENSDIGKAVSAGKTGGSKYLLSGLLVAPDGAHWQVNATYYNLKPTRQRRGRYVKREHVDSAVLQRAAHDMSSPDFVRALTREAQAQAGTDDPASDLRQEVVRINDQISRTMDLAASLSDPGPALRKVDELEVRRRDAATQIDRIEREHSARMALRSVTEESMRATLDGLWQGAEEKPTHALKEMLRAFVESVELDPETLNARMQYRIAVDAADPEAGAGDSKASLASPRGFEPLLPP